MSKVIRLALLALVVIAPTLWAAETEYSGSFCAHAKRTVLESNADVTIYLQEYWGISTPASAPKPLENATVHCIQYVRNMNGKHTAKGACVWVDSTGDTFTGETEDVPDQPGVWTFLTGTGKWKGIKGVGTYKTVSSGKPAQDGTILFCVERSGKYTLP